ACPFDERSLQVMPQVFPDALLYPGEAAEGWLFFTSPTPWASSDEMVLADYRLRCELPQPCVICYERTYG
ncbi:MAG: hypothetical protein OEZ24_03515, partial [Candidatus Bathyarchaeota archaeon]|nr:hypothetical protein [Candidatus Bathyarchaeota archaeon]